MAVERPGLAGAERPLRLDEPIVIGAGPGGLAAARALERRGIPARLFERGDRVCMSWRAHYDSLQLNSPRRMSSLPGLRIDRRAGAWPGRDDFIAYVERYAEPLASRIAFGTDVRRIDREDGGWRLETSRGPMWSRHVIVAAGLLAVPFMPSWPGREEFEGQLVHAADYRNAERYRGRDVLLVGMGQTGSDVGIDLVRGGVGRLRVAVRTPPVILRRRAWVTLTNQLAKYMHTPDAMSDTMARLYHRLMWGSLESYGLGAPGDIATSRKSRSGTLGFNRGVGFTFDRGLVSAIKKRYVEVVAAVERFEGGDVVLVDGRRLRPDVVIAATGRRPNLAPIVGHLGVLNSDGRPSVHGGRTAHGAPGMYFIGYRLPPAQLPDMTLDAHAIARGVSRS
ncbi:MAG TPA: NAD(P)/FAD-dependent oxidoreductase [Thermoleophilaceae bacterium]|jgi:cation diffusion facilitator CzcD-associated flavoprotein CzcO